MTEWIYRGYRCVLGVQPDNTFHGCVLSGNSAKICVDVDKSLGEKRARQAVESLVSILRAHERPWNLDALPITDVALVPDRGAGGEPGRLPLPFDLGHDLRIVPVRREEAALVFRACDPPGDNRLEATDLRAPLYAIERTNAPRSPAHEWDSDDRLQLAIALSRLVRPNSASFEYAVRIIGDIRSGQFSLYPGPIGGLGGLAFVADLGDDSLRNSDLPALRDLVGAFFSDPPSPTSRPMRAFWYHEYAARSRDVAVRLPLLVTAAEALVSTSSANSSLQFRTRVPALSQLVTAPQITPDQAKRLWRLRSKMVHGATDGGLSPEELGWYSSLERVIQGALRRCIVDRGFFGHFLAPEAIDTLLPVPRSAPLLCDRCRVPLSPGL